MCSFPYTAAVKTVQALWPKVFFSSKKYLYHLFSLTGSKDFALHFCNSSVISNLLSNSICLVRLRSSKVVADEWSLAVHPSGCHHDHHHHHHHHHRHQVTLSRKGCLLGRIVSPLEDRNLGPQRSEPFEREPQQDGPGTTHTRFSGCVPAEKCRTGWKCGNRKKCHNGNYLTGTWIPHELLGSDVNLSTGCQCLCERASTCCLE